MESQRQKIPSLGNEILFNFYWQTQILAGYISDSNTPVFICFRDLFKLNLP